MAYVEFILKRQQFYTTYSKLLVKHNILFIRKICRSNHIFAQVRYFLFVIKHLNGKYDILAYLPNKKFARLRNHKDMPLKRTTQTK